MYDERNSLCQRVSDNFDLHTITNRIVSKALIIYASGPVGAEVSTQCVVRGQLRNLMRLNPYFSFGSKQNTQDTNEWLVTPPFTSGKTVQYKFHEFENIQNSVYSDLDHALKIGTTINNYYSDYDVFIVLVGMDNICYMSSLVSFMFQRLSKLIIFTGGLIPMETTYNDSFQNVLHSLTIAAEFSIRDVIVVNRHKCMRANRSKRSVQGMFNCIESPNFPPLIEIGINFKYNSKLFLPFPVGNPIFHSKFSDQIKVIKYHPLMKAQTFQYELADPTVRAIIIQSYGSASIPVSSGLIDSCLNAKERKILIVNIAQTFQYPSICYQESQLEKYNIVCGRDITLEGCIAKLSFLLGQNHSYQTMMMLIKKNLRGELTQNEDQLQFERQPETMLESIESVLQLNTSKNQHLYLRTVLHALLKHCSHYFSLEKFEQFFGTKNNDCLHMKFNLKEILHSAVKSNNSQLVKFYLNNKVSPNENDKWGRLPLMYALKNQNQELVAQLALNNAKLIGDYHPNSIQEVKELFVIKIQHDKLLLFQLLVKAKQIEQAKSFEDSQKRNIGHYCVVFRAQKCLTFLTSNKILPSSYFLSADVYGVSASQYAKQFNYPEMVSLVQ